MPKNQQQDQVVVFDTALGWVALILRGPAVRQITFGHRSEQAAVAALDAVLVEGAKRSGKLGDLARRLRNFATGKPMDFSDVEVDLATFTPFQRQVLGQCRRVPYGTTLTYAELAVRAGAPGAARAVGNCMARNPIPLVIPCHRIVPAGGTLGGFSAPGGVSMKRRLLAMEAALVAPVPRRDKRI